MFVFKVDTPEELKTAIVVWLRWNASQHRIKAGKMIGKIAAKTESEVAAAYDSAASFIEAAKVEPK